MHIDHHSGAASFGFNSAHSGLNDPQLYIERHNLPALPLLCKVGKYLSIGFLFRETIPSSNPISSISSQLSPSMILSASKFEE